MPFPFAEKVGELEGDNSCTFYYAGTIVTTQQGALLFLTNS